MLAGGPSTLHASSHQVSSRYRLSDEAFCCMSVQLHARAGAGTSEGAVSCRGYVPKRPTILVVGNEGRGLRTAVERVCEGVLRINAAPSPGRIAPQGVDSLNVSVATGILLHQLLQPRAAVRE